jgi:acetyl-CoA C-acetyltransferase
MLQRQNLAIDDVDLWEINEAFAAQVLGCIAAWKDAGYCKNELGLDDAYGELDSARLNVDGGSVAIGHPVGASGARIILHLLNVLERQNKQKGVATICIGGGQGGSVLLERA